jgi:hypothetical protein
MPSSTGRRRVDFGMTMPPEMIEIDAEGIDSRTVTGATVRAERHIEYLTQPRTRRAVTNGTAAGELSTRP